MSIRGKDCRIVLTAVVCVLSFAGLTVRAQEKPAQAAKNVAIRSGTSVAAELLGWSDQMGTIEPGKWADLVAISGAH